MLYTEQLHSVLFAYKFWLQNKAYWLCLYRRRRVKRQAVTLACEKLGERLFEARDRAGLTLRELGQRSGVSWWKMGAANKGAPPQWLSTHPAGTTRIRDLETNIPAVEGLYARAEKPARRFEPPKPSASVTDAGRRS